MKILQKIVIILVVLLFMFGCATEKTQVCSTTLIGLMVGVDTQKIPTVRLGYVRVEAASVNQNHNVDIQREFKDVSLFSATGNIKQSLKVEGTTKEGEVENECE